MILTLQSEKVKSSTVSSDLFNAVHETLEPHKATIDVCILNDSFELFWNDLVRNFTHTASAHNYVVIQPDTLVQTRRSCSLFLVYLEWDFKYPTFVKSLLAARYWNRFAMLVFITVVNEEVIVQKNSVRSNYASLVHTLGILKSVSLIWISSKSFFNMFYYNQFGYTTQFHEMRLISQIGRRDYL